MKTPITYIVVAYYKLGFTIKATELSFEDAYILKQTLDIQGYYESVSIGATGAYFVNMAKNSRTIRGFV